MNSKLEHAIFDLKEKNISCVIMLNYKEPIYSTELGIKPLMNPLRKDKKAFENGVIADKVIGKAAAMMAVYGGAKAVYGGVMSVDAKAVLERYGVEFAYDELVPYIKNRTQTGRCPMETAVLDIDDLELAYKAIEEKLVELAK